MSRRELLAVEGRLLGLTIRFRLEFVPTFGLGAVTRASAAPFNRDRICAAWCHSVLTLPFLEATLDVVRYRSTHRMPEHT